MNKNYKAAISGAQSQGKTTLLKAIQLSTALNEYHFSYLTGVARSVGKYLPINEGGTLLTQYMVLSKHVEACLQPGRWITDRSVLDVISYTKYHLDDGTLSVGDYLTLTAVYKKCIQYYDRIFYIVPELPLENDGGRSVDQEYFKAIVCNFEALVFELQQHTNKIVLVKGTIADRVKIIEDQIKADLTLEKL